jgi:hypothetical protein
MPITGSREGGREGERVGGMREGEREGGMEAGNKSTTWIHNDTCYMDEDT